MNLIMGVLGCILGLILIIFAKPLSSFLRVSRGAAWRIEKKEEGINIRQTPNQKEYYGEKRAIWINRFIGLIIIIFSLLGAFNIIKVS